MEQLNQNHQKFLNHLDKSLDSVWVVAKMLQFKGHEVRIPPLSKAKNHKDWANHADSGDLFISQRIEVKKLTVNFTSCEDWPFKTKFIVCAKHSFDLANPKPYAYIILSDNKKFAATVFASDSNLWYAETRQDHRYEKVSQEFYFSPIEKVHFFKLPEL